MLKQEPQFIIDNDGNQTAVVVPVKQWQRIVKQLQRDKERFRFLKDMRDAFVELEDIKRGKQKPVSVKQLLNELPG